MSRTQTTATSSHQVYSQHPFKHIIRDIQVDIADRIFYTADLISCIWQVDKIATTETKTFSCGYNDTGHITGRITPLHSSLYFLDFVSADGKRLPVENKISVWDLSDGPVKIELGGGLNQPEEFYYLTSVRAYQVKYEGRDVQKISFRSRTETRVSLGWAGAVIIHLPVEFMSLTYGLFSNETVPDSRFRHDWMFCLRWVFEYNIY